MNDEDILFYLNNPCRIISNTCDYPSDKLKDLYEIVFNKKPETESMMYVHERIFLNKLKDYPEI